jgi:hypothetical protein
MHQELYETHFRDKKGNPLGGITKGRGIEIRWQKGPLGRGGERIEPNGAFVEGVIAAALGRLKVYQDSKFACPENAQAILHLAAALKELEDRTAEREERGVGGTWEP